MAYELIETIELASAASSIEFTSIPQDGVDLLLKVSARTDRGAVVDNLDLNINGVSTNLTFLILYGSGSTADSLSLTSQTGFAFSGDTSTTSTFGNGSLYFSNYTSSAAKSISADLVTENNATAGYQNLVAGLWDNTSAITSIALLPQFGSNFVSDSTASLYKIS